MRCRCSSDRAGEGNSVKNFYDYVRDGIINASKRESKECPKMGKWLKQSVLAKLLP